MKIRISYIVFFVGTFLGLAQNDSLSNPYFISYADKGVVGVYFYDSSNNFITNFEVDGEKKELNLIPNGKNQMGVNLSYRYLDISIGFAPKFFHENKDNSNSKLYSLSTRLNFKKWIQSLVFINQTGFYVSDDEIEIAFPNLRTTKIGGTTSYVFNDNFSYRTITNQKEWQTKSSGSFIPNFTFFYTNFDLNNGSAGEHADLYELALSPSYFYNWIIKKRFLISSGVASGAGISITDGDVSPLFEITGSFKIGYNVAAFFTYVNLNFTSFNESSNSEIRISDNFYNLRFTLGYRFNPPQKVKEVYDISTQKIGIEKKH